MCQRYWSEDTKDNSTAASTLHATPSICIVDIPYHYQEHDEKDPSSLLLQLLRNGETRKQNIQPSDCQDVHTK